MRSGCGSTCLLIDERVDHDLRVLIVDDEALARSRLRTCWPTAARRRAEVVGEAANAAQALELLRDASASTLVLLDIHMPGTDGTGAGRRLRELAEPPAVVFVTAHAEHAVTAFELEAVDYLTKPVRRERLQAALQKVGAPALQRAGAGAAEAAARSRADRQDRGRTERVPVAEVLYFKAELKYVTVRTAAHSYILDDSLSELEERLGDALPARASQRAGGARARCGRWKKHLPTTAKKARRLGGAPERRSTNGWRCRAGS